tara:strand:- start:94 stop:894 length:801 start_codon:yes stop_codon:yes gene_type:complete
VFSGALALGANQCTINIGDSINFESLASLVESFNSTNIEQDEFETTEEFEQRKRSTLNKEILEDNLLLKATYSSEHANYNADTEQFNIQSFAWTNLGVGWDRVFPRFNEYKIEANFWSNHAAGLARTDEVIGSYTGTNAFGNSVDVTKYQSTIYGVFDRMSAKSVVTMEAGKKTWKMDFIDNENNREVIRIDVPRERARFLKENMQVGILVQPKPPYLVVTEDTKKPTRDYPAEIETTTYAFVADIICAIITDENGIVLRTVDVDY